MILIFFLIMAFIGSILWIIYMIDTYRTNKKQSDAFIKISNDLVDYLNGQNNE